LALQVQFHNFAVAGELLDAQGGRFQLHITLLRQLLPLLKQVQRRFQRQVPRFQLGDNFFQFRQGGFKR